MPFTQDFVMDNLGSPDQYTVQTPCQKVTLREKNRDVATPAKFNVYLPYNGSNYKPYEMGEAFVFIPGYVMLPLTKIFAAETVNVASATFVVTEE